MNGLCTGAGQRNGALALELRAADGSERLLELRPGEELAFEAGTARQCIGYRRPQDNQLVSCPHNATGLTGSQCDACLRASFTLPCLLCTGDRCNNPPRRAGCVQPDNHITYLASFGPGILKVGVARHSRRVERLTEQGARAAIAVARDDGQQVRRLETYIKRHVRARQATRDGIIDALVPDRIAPTTKLWAYTRAAVPEAQRVNETSRHDRELAALHDELHALLSAIKPRIRARWMTPAETIPLPPLPYFKTPPRYVQLKAQDRLRGTIMFVIGQLLIINSDTGEQIALETGSLVGYQLRALADGEHSEAQLAIAV